MNDKCESKNDNLVMNITSCLQSMNISLIDEIFFFSLERYLRLSSWIIFLKLINFDNGKWLILIIRVLPDNMRKIIFEENVLGNILWRCDNILRRWENICGDIIQFGILCKIRAAPVLIKVWYDVVKI